jgi:hypothetical protein
MARYTIVHAALLGLSLAGGLLSQAAWSQSTDYKVEVQPTLNGLPITIEPVPFSGRLVMKLTNGGTQKVRCDRHHRHSMRTSLSPSNTSTRVALYDAYVQRETVVLPTT